MEHAQLTPELIVDLLFEPKPTLEICARHDLSLHQLAEILDSDEYHRLEADLTRIQHRRAPALRRRTLAALEHIANQTPTSPTHAETIRKAAAQLLRVTNAPPQDPNDDTPDTPDDPDETPKDDEESVNDNQPSEPSYDQSPPPRLRGRCPTKEGPGGLRPSLAPQGRHQACEANGVFTAHPSPVPAAPTARAPYTESRRQPLPDSSPAPAQETEAHESPDPPSTDPARDPAPTAHPGAIHHQPQSPVSPRDNKNPQYSAQPPPASESEARPPSSPSTPSTNASQAA